MMIETDMTILDVESGIARLGGNKSLYIHLLKRFHENLNNGIPLLGVAPSAESLKDFQRELHSLKGVSGNLSAIALYEGCSALDASMKLGSPDQELYNNVIRICLETQNEVGKFLKENM